jgi:hypothetical protein
MTSSTHNSTCNTSGMLFFWTSEHMATYMVTSEHILWTSEHATNICRSDRQSPQPPPWICLDLAHWVKGLQSQLKVSCCYCLLPLPYRSCCRHRQDPRWSWGWRCSMGGADRMSRQQRRRERWSPNHNHARIGSGRRWVGETSRTTLLEPPPPPRSMGHSCRLVRRRGLRLQTTTGCFLQKQQRRDEPRRPVVHALSQLKTHVVRIYECSSSGPGYFLVIHLC